MKPGREVCENPPYFHPARRETLNRIRTIGFGPALVAAALAASAVAACKREEPVVVAAPTTPPPAAPPGAVAEQMHIAAAQQILARDPKNVRAWIDLGNEYFDSHQAQKAVDAYARALELDPKNPDVLTDQGVMYRDLGAHDKALANFKKASQIDPHHLQSLYNMGVVYAYDLKDAKRATEAWNRVIEIGPASPQAAQARKLIDELKQQPAAR